MFEKLALVEKLSHLNAVLMLATGSQGITELSEEQAQAALDLACRLSCDALEMCETD